MADTDAVMAQLIKDNNLASRFLEGQDVMVGIWPTSVEPDRYILHNNNIMLNWSNIHTSFLFQSSHRLL